VLPFGVIINDKRLAKQLSREIFRLVRIFKELQQELLVCHGGIRIDWNGKQNVQFVHNLVNTILCFITYAVESTITE